jgi:hypothetical protein
MYKNDAFFYYLKNNKKLCFYKKRGGYEIVYCDVEGFVIFPIYQKSDAR